MTDKQMLILMEKMGPDAATALDSWLSLQWTKFWLLDVLAPIATIAMLLTIAYFLLVYLGGPKDEEE